MFRRSALIVGVAATATLVCGTFAFWPRSSYRTAVSNSTWELGGEPSIVTVELADETGDPIAGANVSVETDSGNCEGVTSNSGACRIRVSEADMTGIDISRMRVLDCSSWYSRIPVNRGLRVKIVLRRDAIIDLDQ